MTDVPGCTGGLGFAHGKYSAIDPPIYHALSTCRVEGNVEALLLIPEPVATEEFFFIIFADGNRACDRNRVRGEEGLVLHDSCPLIFVLLDDVLRAPRNILGPRLADIRINDCVRFQETEWCFVDERSGLLVPIILSAEVLVDYLCRALIFKFELPERATRTTIFDPAEVAVVPRSKRITLPRSVSFQNEIHRLEESHIVLTVLLPPV